MVGKDTPMISAVLTIRCRVLWSIHHLKYLSKVIEECLQDTFKAVNENVAIGNN